MAEHISEVANSRILESKTSKTILDSRILEKRTVAQTDSIADYLVSKYDAPDYRPIFLKAAWRLSEARINGIVEASQKAPFPRAYFIKSVKNDKAYNG